MERRRKTKDGKKVGTDEGMMKRDRKVEKKRKSETRREGGTREEMEVREG